MYNKQCNAHRNKYQRNNNGGKRYLSRRLIRLFRSSSCIFTLPYSPQFPLLCQVLIIVLFIQYFIFGRNLLGKHCRKRAIISFKSFQCIFCFTYLRFQAFQHISPFSPVITCFRINNFPLQLCYFRNTTFPFPFIRFDFAFHLSKTIFFRFTLNYLTIYNPDLSHNILN